MKTKTKAEKLKELSRKIAKAEAKLASINAELSCLKAKQEELDNPPIEVLKLGPSISCDMRNKGIKGVRDLYSYITGGGDLENFRGVGEKRAEEIRQAVENFKW